MDMQLRKTELIERLLSTREEAFFSKIKAILE